MSLPVPDLGLKCPDCGAALAGLEEHRCAACGQRFNILAVVAHQRPIVDLGFECLNCGYSLTGLEGNRCPECGGTFTLEDQLEELRGSEPVVAPDDPPVDPPDHRIARRQPQFTGQERPMPDFGLTCSECDENLVGTMNDACPKCGVPFDLDPLRNGDAWVDITSEIPRGMGATIPTLLYDDQVPYITQSLRNAYTGVKSSWRLLVPREFIFDALYVIAEARGEAGVTSNDKEWICPACQELVPGSFDECWHCQTERDASKS